MKAGDGDQGALGMWAFIPVRVCMVCMDCGISPIEGLTVHGH